MESEQVVLREPKKIENKLSSSPLEVIRRLISKIRFFPKTHDFFSYFERSSRNILDGTKLLQRMIANKGEREELVHKLKDYEHVGDKITHDVVDLLHQTFLTPFDRSDIHTLVTKMDDILDIVYYVGKRMTIYDVSDMPEEVAQLADIVNQSAEEISKAIAGLESLKNVKKVLNHCIEVNRLENEADEKMNVVIEKLFRNGWNPIEVIKLKEIVENLEAAEDKCEDVANIIENIILKHA
jgi:hypothetical protein